MPVLDVIEILRNLRLEAFLPRMVVNADGCFGFLWSIVDDKE